MPALFDVDLAALFGPDARRSPEMQALWDELLPRAASLPNWLDLAPAAARAQQDELYAAWNVDPPAVGRSVPLRIPGSPPVGAVLHVPREATPGCILFFHGGGWAFGSPTSHDRFARILAKATATPVLSVDYRLAPEHAFPEPLEDCSAAWRWLIGPEPLDRAGLGDLADCDLRGGPLAVAGDSAGANLAIGVMLDAVAQGLRRPDVGLLFYGVFSADFDSPAYRRFGEDYGLSRAGMARFWDWYVPGESNQLRRDPRVSSVEADQSLLAQLPPLYLNAAGLDPLLSDTLVLAEKLRDAGTPHRLVVHAGLHHGFMQMTSRLAEAREAFDLAATFYRETLGRSLPM